MILAGKRAHGFKKPTMAGFATQYIAGAMFNDMYQPERHSGCDVIPTPATRRSDEIKKKTLLCNPHDTKSEALVKAFT